MPAKSASKTITRDQSSTGSQGRPTLSGSADAGRTPAFRERLALKALLMPGGLGSTMKVLILGSDTLRAPSNSNFREVPHMFTVVAAALPQPVSVRKYDRVFYSSIAIGLALTALVGFGPTYYFKAFGQGPMATLSGGPMTLLVHAHGALFSAWVLLFIVQTALVAQHKVSVHRRLGIAGGVLAALMVVVGTLAALKMAARGAAPAGVDPLSFLMIPLSDMLFFGGFVAAALRLRANREAHKRLMLLAYVSIIVAAVARFPGVLPLGPLAFFGLAFLFIFAGVIYDVVTRRRVHPAYLWGGGVLLVSVPLRLMISTTGAWKAFAQWTVGLV